jgi:hypothetical protein
MPYEEYVKRRAEYRKALGLDATPPPKSEFAPPDDEFDDLVSTED